MKKIYLLLLTATLFTFSSIHAQVTVAGSTGADGTYASLTQAGGAFAAINAAGSQAGNNILITITSDVTTENGANGLNNGGWTTLTINPSGVRTLSGTVALPLINLNGANNVRIDGLNSGGNSLTISNASTATTAGTSTIRFVNDASNNTVTNCTLLGSGTGVVGALNTATIIFGGTTGSTGNDNNSLINNNIGDAAGGLPSVAISSFGQSAALSNDNNTVSGNNIYNYFLVAASNAVNIGSNSSAWTISNNRFYQAAARAGATGFQKAIAINTTSGGNYTISGNTIGYATSAGTGTMTYSPGTAARFTAIELAVAATPVSNVQGNTVTAISFGTTSGASTLGAGIFHGIIVTAGGVNIGTTTGNVIGATSGTGSITVTSTTNGGLIHGIYVSSTTGASIQNNSIGSLSTGGTATIGYSFIGIHTAGTGSHSVTLNTVGNATANNIAIGTLGTTTASCSLYGIRSTATGTTISLGTLGNGNTVQNMSNYSTNAGSVFYGIFNTGAAATLNINSNTVTQNTLYGGGSASTSFYYMSIISSGNSASAINIRSNIINSSNLATASFGGLAGFISNIGAGSSSTVTISDNTLSGFNYSGATGGTGSSSFLGIDQEASPLNVVISNNEFNNISLKNAGFTAIIYADNDAPNVTISSNFITTAFTCTSASTAGFTGIVNVGGAGTVTTGTQNVTNNNFTNISINNSTATAYGILYEPGSSSTSGPSVTVSGNTLGITNTGTSDLNGIFADFSTALNINSNTIQALVTGGGTAYGIQSHFFSGTASVYKNKIYGIANNGASGVVNGMNFGNATSTATNTLNIYNNLIGDLSAPSSSGNNQVNGISLTGIAANTYNVYYNSVYLNTAGGANFGTAALLANTTPTVNLRNNLLVNLSTPSGTGRTTAYQRSSTTLSTYSLNSNNNLFYAGTPGATNLIYYDGTNADQTLAAFKARVSLRDVSSVTENPTFLSTTGSNANFLHIDASVPTQVESGANNISGYTDDYDAQVRQGNGGYSGTGTAPDIGADEFEGIAIDATAPVITYTLLPNTVCASNVTLTAAITDPSGVNVLSGTKPRLYYKKSTDNNTYVGNTSADNGWKYVEATNASSPFSFTTDFSILNGGSATVGDVIQYFVVAQDNVTPTPNVGLNNGIFTATPASVALTAGAFPITGTINSYTILSGIPTTVTIGAAGTYPTLTGVGGLFAAINTNGLSGNTVATILDATIAENGANALNAISSGCSGSYTLTIKPATGVSPVLSGSNATALVNLSGANSVIIDGSNNGTSSKNLTISNTSTGGSTLLLNNGASNNMIKNCILQGVVTSAGAGVLTLGSTTIGGSGNSNNVIQNNDITRGTASRPAVCVYNAGLAGSPNTANVISGNRIMDFSSLGFSDGNGTTEGYSNNTQFSYNEIFQNSSATTALSGVQLNNALGITNMFLFKNYIHDLTTSSTGTLVGINLFDAASVQVSNNMIALSNATGNIRGIAQQLGLGSTANVYYNTVSIYGSTTSTYVSFCLLKNFTSIGDNIKNNIFSNTRLSSGTGKQYAISTTTVGTYTSDYNDFYSSGNVRNVLGAAVSVDQATIAAWRTATSGDANSLNIQPVFVSATNLHLTAADNCGLNGKATPISITTDYDDQVRDALTPDIGADEFTPTMSTTLGGVVSTTVCDSRTISGTTDFTANTCNLLATVQPAGASPVSGTVNTCVYIDPAVLPTYNAEPYVQRHIDITPATNPTTSTGRITLYFTDAEFTTFNANNAAWPDLPTAAGGGNSDPNIANLRVTQYHGTPNTSPSSPNQYSGGTATLINPNDADIVWNGNYWAVSFDVTGFSGFYVHTNLRFVLPIELNYFRGSKQGSSHLLDWKVTCNATPTATLVLERSSSATGGFAPIYSINATAARCNQPFNYTDAQPLAGMNYYRVKMIDATGKITYSGIVALLNATKGFEIVSIAPNPVVDGNFKLNVAAAQATRMDVVIIDMQGRTVKREQVSLGAGFTSKEMNVANLAPGTYNLYGVTADGKSSVLRFVKQ